MEPRISFLPTLFSPSNKKATPNIASLASRQDSHAAPHLCNAPKINVINKSGGDARDIGDDDRDEEDNGRNGDDDESNDNQDNHDNNVTINNGEVDEPLKMSQTPQ